MKRLLFLAVLLALALAPVAPAETVHNLLQQNNRALAPYDLSVIPELLRSNANVFFVDNEATNASDAADGLHGETPELPFKTYDYAIGRCTAGQNNVIVILPYSVERYTGAGSVDVEVTGITTIGLGYGPARPKFVFDHADATFVVGRDGDGATFRNLVFQASVTGVTVGIQVEDGADSITFIDCEWPDGELSSTDEFVTAVDFVNEANDVDFERCKFTSVGAGATAAIDIGDGAVAGLTLKDCTFYGDYSVACVFSDQALTRVLIKDCDFYNANADEFGIEAQGTGNVGFVRGCTFTTSGSYVDAGGLTLAGNIYKTASDSNSDAVQYSLADNGITAAKIASDAIGASEVADSAIDAGAIAADAITAAKIATDAIAASEIADNAIDAGAIAANAITAAKIATDAIGSDELAATATAEIVAAVDPNKVINDSPRVLVKTVASMASGWGTANSPVTLFTVTGDVLVRCFAIVKTACTSTDNDGTLSVGVVGDVACVLVADTVDGTAFVQHDCWTLDQAADTPSAEMDTNWVLIPDGLDISATIGTNNMTAGAITYYLQWIPLSADAAITAP